MYTAIAILNHLKPKVWINTYKFIFTMLRLYQMFLRLFALKNDPAGRKKKKE